MTHCIKEFDYLDKDIQDKIYDYIKINYDIEKRSLRMVIVDNVLLDNLDNLIDIINKRDNYYDYILVKNDITYTTCIKNNFFEKHEDYSSNTPNTIEEFSFIMCVDANCEGGEIILYLNESFKHISLNGKIKYRCIIFRKDIRYEDVILKSGYKSIITINLLGIPKYSGKSLIIILNDDTKYIMSFEKIFSLDDNILKTFLDQIVDVKKYVTYNEKNFNADEFKIIYDIFNRTYVSLEKLNKYSYVINYFNIDYKYIYITELNTSNLKSSNSSEFAQTMADNIILCNTEEKYNDICTYIKNLLLPYIPFKLILCEGHIVYEDESSTPPMFLRMSPVYMSMGDYNNVLIETRLISLNNHNISFKNILNQKDINIDICNIIKNLAKKYNISAAEVGFSSQYHFHDDVDNEIIPFIKYNKYIIKYNKNTNKFTFIYDYEDDKILVPLLLFYNKNLTNDKIIERLDNQSSLLAYDNYYNIEMLDINLTKFKYYSLDENNDMVLKGDHIDAIIKKLKNMDDFIKIVIELFKKLNIIFPQQKKHVGHFIHDDYLYGDLDFIQIFGFLRME